MIFLNLSDINQIKTLLGNEDFAFKKSLGQNFLVDGSVAPRMAEFSADKDTGVIEIGPGAGVLTKELSLRAKKVVAIELDSKLKPVLNKTVGSAENVKIVFADVLKTDLKSIIDENFKDCASVSVCANLPYYITSPVIMKLLKEKLPIKNITVMVQKEAGERICAKVGTRQSGALTAVINYYATAKPLFFVPKEAFLPKPKVDSQVISLKMCNAPAVEVKDEEFFFRTINACFMLRRKTAVNSISSAMGINKETVTAVFNKLGISPLARGENFDMQTLAQLATELKGV